MRLAVALVFFMGLCPVFSLAMATKKGPKDPLFEYNGMTLAAVLGVAPDASKDQVKSRHRLLAQKHHPDRGGDVRILQLINLAYTALLPESDPHANVNHTPFDLVKVTQKKGEPATFSISVSISENQFAPPAAQSMEEKFKEKKEFYPGMSWEEFLDLELNQKVPEGKSYDPRADAYIDHVTGWRFVYNPEYDEYINRDNPLKQVLYYIPESFGIYSPKWDGFLLPYNAKWRGLAWTDPQAWILPGRVNKAKDFDRVSQRMEGTKAPGGPTKFYSEEVQSPLPKKSLVKLSIEGSVLDFILKNKILPIQGHLNGSPVYFSTISKAYLLLNRKENWFEEVPRNFVSGFWEFIDEYREAHPEDTNPRRATVEPLIPTLSLSSSKASKSCLKYFP